MSLYEKAKQGVETVVSKYKEANEDGKLSFSEIVSLTSTVVGQVVAIAESAMEGTGAEKKQAVLDAVGQAYDEYIEPIDIARIPNFIEPAIDKGAKQLLLAVADGTIDAIVALFNENGWPNASE
tara:strand:+ start:523 stop:894 length:372 start_codon:yes stop_codon:yes gene_type:complete